MSQDELYRTAQNSLSRRKFMHLLGLSGVALGAGVSQAKAAKTKTSAHIVIIGGGAAGLAAANQLAARLDGAKITVIDARKEHYYQPGYTLVAAGIKPASYVISSTADYIPSGVDWIAERAAEIDPDGKKVKTEGGKTLSYDWLIVATGLQLNYGAIEGMDTALIGTNGLGSVYASPEAAAKTWAAASAFADKGGIGIFSRPNTEMKCAGAPLKYTFIVDDYLRRRGNRGKAELYYLANNKAFFSVPIVNEKVRMLFRDRQVKTSFDNVMTAIDPAKRVVTFKTPDGMVQRPYDFIDVIPPMTAPDVVRKSPLPWATGPWAAEGWVDVDQKTLRHKRYPNVFAVGDIAGVPKGKTAASVKWQVPVAVDHIVGDISGTPAQSVYNGYTSCPLITKLGQAMLIEFDYENNLVQSFPGVIAPLEELWVSWVMKTMALKPTYISMLRGVA